MKNKKELVLDVILLLFLTLGFFWRVLFENKFLFFGQNLIPWYTKFYYLSIRDNFLPLAIKEFGFSIFYPTNFILSLFINLTKNMDLGFRLLEFCSILHFFLVSLFTYFLIRYGVRLSRYASLFGAICFAFSGIFVTHILNFSFFYSITWLPLILLFYLRGLDSNKKSNFIFSGLILGFSVFSGSLYGIYYSSLLLLSYSACVLFLDRRKNSLDLVLKTILVFISGWFMAGIYILLNYIYTGNPLFKDHLSYVAIDSNKNFFLSVLLPNLYIYFNGWWETRLYLGIPTLMFAFFAFTYIRKNKNVIYFAIVFLIFSAIVFILSKKILIEDTYLKLKPIMEFFDYPMRLRLLSNLSLIILACFGIDGFSLCIEENKARFLRAFFYLMAFFSIIVISIILPIYYTRVIVDLNTKTFIDINNLCWFFLIFIINLIVMSLAVLNRRKALLRIIIFLLVIDIFTYWSLSPVNYQYGYGWDIESPSAHYYIKDQ